MLSAEQKEAIAEAVIAILKAAHPHEHLNFLKTQPQDELESVALAIAQSLLERLPRV